MAYVINPHVRLGFMFTHQDEIPSRGREDTTWWYEWVSHIFPVKSGFTAHVNWGHSYVLCFACIINLEFVLFIQQCQEQISSLTSPRLQGSFPHIYTGQYVFSYCVFFLFFSKLSTLKRSLFPPSGAFAIHLNMTSEQNEFALKVAVRVSLNWTLLLEVLLICSDISISSCYPGLVSACASKPVFTPRLDHSILSR